MALALAGCGGAAAGPPPSLVLVSIDTLRADHVGAYGYDAPTTPALDALAREGVRFEHCIAHAPTTLTSHASLLTSRLPRHHGASIQRSSRLADGVPTLAEVLRGAGYRTASFNGGVQLDPVWGLDRGFDVYESAHGAGAEAALLVGPESTLRAKVDRALAWLDASRGPFFLFLHTYEIHHPYTPDPALLARLDPDYAGDLGDAISVELLKAVMAGERRLAPEDRAHVVAAYDAELRSVDEALGRLLAALRARGLYDGAMIVVTSDHGEEFGEHALVGWHGHSLYDELLRVPLVVKFPGARHAGATVRAQVRGIDVAPTVLAALGLPAPAGFAGRDLAPLVTAEGARPLPAVSMFDDREAEPRWSIRADGWKLVLSHAQPQLFDLVTDPKETINLSARHPERVDALRVLGTGLLDAQPEASGTPVTPPDAVSEGLRALGYVE